MAGGHHHRVFISLYFEFEVVNLVRRRTKGLEVLLREEALAVLW
jgi:hypothetical protein